MSELSQGLRCREHSLPGILPLELNGEAVKSDRRDHLAPPIHLSTIQWVFPPSAKKEQKNGEIKWSGELPGAVVKGSV